MQCYRLGAEWLVSSPVGKGLGCWQTVAEGAGEFSLEQAQRDCPAYNGLEGGYSQVSVRLFPQASSNRTSGHSLNLCHGRLKLDIRKNFFTEKGIRYWRGLAREVFKERLDLTLSAMV